MGVQVRVASVGCRDAGATVEARRGGRGTTTVRRYGTETPGVDGHRRAWVNGARLVMLGLAVVIGWAAVAAAGGTGQAVGLVLAGPPSLTATAAPAALTAADLAPEDAEPDDARRTTRGSRSQDRLDPRFPGCDAVRAAGLGPYQEARDAEYRWYPDADSDGVTCD